MARIASAARPHHSGERNGQNGGAGGGAEAGGHGTQSAKHGTELDEMFGAAKILPQIRMLEPGAAKILPRIKALGPGQPDSCPEWGNVPGVAHYCPEKVFENLCIVTAYV